ncbi:DNA-binding response regulator [Anaerotruncus sp. 80]|uniref:DNA-binding response regulator n=2 Tax=Bacillota TaxID=1239 RepID=A0A845QHZ7_9FIRM|nr:DNA-binding response regulator [Anaerotruncus colihominis]NCE98792.1 DNA-binding response regulator [Emergencia sp. 1XD21-10]NCF02417.1 DNA-binding response regulator [Anaerotruncus sp. 80]
MAAIILFREIYWIRLIIDVPLIGLLIVGSISSILNSVRSKAPKRFIAYKIVITFFMTVNYISYFISESGWIDGDKEVVMNITIYYWLVINAANMVLQYKRDFRSSYTSEAPVVMELSEALANVQNKYELTKREIEILEEIYSGKTNTQIAEALFISESTVKAHVYNLFRKLGVKSRVEAVCIVREEKEPKA